MTRALGLPVAAVCALAAFASGASGQPKPMSESEMRAAFPGRSVSIKSAKSGTWIMLTMKRDGRCALTWSARPYRTRCHIRGSQFCYVSGQKRGLVCGTMSHIRGADYLFRAK